MSNQISFLLLPIAALITYYNYQANNLPVVMSLTFLMVLFISVPVFNGVGLSLLSRLLLSVLPNLILIVPPVLYKSIDPGNFQGLAFTTITLSIFPLLLFNFNREKSWLVFALILNVLVVAGYDVILKTFIVESTDLSLQSQFVHTKIPQVYLLVVIAAAFLFYQTRNYKVQSEALVANQKLTETNQKLQSQYAELQKSRQAVHGQSEIIAEQAEQMKERNKTLSEHGHILLQLAKSDFVQKGVISGALEEVTRTIALAVNLSRVSIWELKNDRFNCSRVYSKIPTNYYEGFQFPLKGNHFINSVHAGEVFYSDKLEQDIRFKFWFDNASENHIQSALVAPYVVNGSIHGFILCEQAEVKKEWTPEDVNLIKVSTDILSMAFASNRIKEETDLIKKQHQEILAQNKFINDQKEEILIKNQSLERGQKELERSLQELQATESALEIKEAESRGILDAINDHNLVVEYNLRGEIIWMNERTMELTGISQKDLEGAYRYSIKSLLLRSNHFNHHEYDSFWSSLSRGVSRKYELRLTLPGTELWVAATFLPIRDEKDEVVKILAVAHDISTVKKQQLHIESQNEKLKDQRKEIIRINNSLENRVKERTSQLETQNKQLTEYAFINAHLLRAPVCNILGLIDLLKKFDLNADQSEIVEFLDTSTKELDEIVMKINRSIKKGYYDDPKIAEQVENWKRKREQNESRLRKIS